MRSRSQHIIPYLVRISCCMFFFLVTQANISAQEWGKLYTVKNGKMYIQLSKQLPESSLDSFIAQYDLYNLALKQFLKTGFEDSLKKLGWHIATNNEITCIITKPLSAFDEINNPADKIKFTEKKWITDPDFPAVSKSVLFGYNSFKNKPAFTIKEDSVVLFFLRYHGKAKKVMLAGSFNNWVPDALPMTRTDSGWIAMVKLSPGKYWYKFIIDGHWTIDHDNRLSENDGKGNTNSVFYFTNTRFRLNGFADAWRVYLAGSFNDWNPRELPMTKTENGWDLPLYLADGTHTYRFVVDGKWITDPGNKNRLPNEFKEFNSVLRIGTPHVFKLNGYTTANQVILTGTFNKWRKDELFMTKTATGWELPYTLGPGNYEYKFIVDGKEIADPGKTNAANKENPRSYLILEPNYTFRLKGHPDAKRVFLAGNFNDWDPTILQMKKEGEDWVFSVHLFAGKYVYKFIVDDKWIIDPGNPLWEQNELGTGNSVLWMGQ